MKRREEYSGILRIYFLKKSYLHWFIYFTFILFIKKKKNKKIVERFLCHFVIKVRIVKLDCQDLLKI